MIGKTISHYRIIDKLGGGGMGVVYKAEDTRLKRLVALKFLPPELTSNPEAKERFIHEAQAASALDHPNICTIHEIDETDDGQLFMCMAFYDGETLKKKIEHGAFKIKEAINITYQVAQGLIKAHERGIIHRDIKPANIMITDEGTAKIVDFGVAKLAGQMQLTKTGATLGTVAYMSPEQVKREKVDQRTDTWSLGIMLYEMLIGQLPFQAEYEAAILYSIVNEEPDHISKLNSSIPLEFENILNKCLTKDPGERYQSISDLLIDLDQFKQSYKFDEKDARFPQNAIQYLPKNLLPKLTIPLFGIILLLIVLWLFLSGQQTVKNLLGIGGLPEKKQLAILPFTNIGGDSNNQAFSDGLVEMLTGKLIQLGKFQKSFWVLPANKICNSKITSIGQVRRAFNVNLIVTGRMQRVGDMIDVEMELFDSRTLYQLNSINISDHIANISTWQNEIIIQVMQMLELEQKPEIHNTLTSGNTALPAAYELYLQGLGYLQRNKEAMNIDTAIGLFTKAVEKDSIYAQAFAALGEAYWRKFEQTQDFQWLEKAQIFCKRAIQLNDHFGPFRISLGTIYRDIGEYEKAITEFQHALRFDPQNYKATRELAITYEESERLTEAEDTYKRVIELRPDYFDGYNILGYFFIYHGRYSEAEKMFRKVTELTPANTKGFNNLGASYSMMDQNDLAITAFQKSLNIKPNPDAYSNLGTIYFFQGRYADALVMFEEAVKLAEDDYIIWGNLVDTYRYVPGYSEKALEVYQHAIKLSKEQLVVNPKDAKLHSSLAVYYAKYGNDKNALVEIIKARELALSDITVLFKFILVSELVNQRDQALLGLQEYLRNGGRIEKVSKDPDLSGLRIDPRYKQIINKGGTTVTDSSEIIN